MLGGWPRLSIKCRKVKDLNFVWDLPGSKHVTGITRHGKTFTVVNSLAQVQAGVLFFNCQQEDAPGYIRADRYTDRGQIITALKAGHKINYIPIGHQGMAELEFECLLMSVITEAMGRGGYKKKLYVVMDEIQDFCPQGNKKSNAHWIARRGQRFGITGVYISQRPQEIEKVLLSQCEQHIIFKVNDFYIPYLNSYRLPGDEIKSIFDQAEKYSFLVYDGLKLEGPFKLDV